MDLLSCRVMSEAPQFHEDINGFLDSLAREGSITVAVMVSSVDGRATVHDRVGDLTGPADQRVLLGAREMASALLVGGRTVRAEGYEGLLDDEAKHRRAARHLAPEPEFVVFTRESPPLPELIAQLRERHPDGPLVSEGGPTLLGMLVEAGLLDQLIVGISPKIVGDDSQKRLIEHAGLLGIELRLIATTFAGGFLFLRYGLRP